MKYRALREAKRLRVESRGNICAASQFPSAFGKNCLSFSRRQLSDIVGLRVLGERHNVPLWSVWQTLGAFWRGEDLVRSYTD